MLWPPSGRDTWQFGYGDRFDEGALEILPAGSVYSEPGQMNHFARTGDEAVLVEISGFGPTDTQYVNSADATQNAKSIDPEGVHEIGSSALARAITGRIVLERGA